MSNFTLVMVSEKFRAEFFARTGNDRILNNPRMYIGMYDEMTKWFIPLRANLSMKKPQGTYFETPFKTKNPHFKRPGLDFQYALYVPEKKDVISISNTLPKEQNHLIDQEFEAIRANFEKYILSIEKLSPTSPQYLMATAPYFPDGIQKIMEKIESRNADFKKGEYYYQTLLPPELQERIIRIDSNDKSGMYISGIKQSKETGAWVYHPQIKSTMDVDGFTLYPERYRKATAEEMKQFQRVEEQNIRQNLLVQSDSVKSSQTSLENNGVPHETYSPKLESLIKEDASNVKQIYKQSGRLQGLDGQELSDYVRREMGIFYAEGDELRNFLPAEAFKAGTEMYLAHHPFVKRYLDRFLAGKLTVVTKSQQADYNEAWNIFIRDYPEQAQHFFDRLNVGEDLPNPDEEIPEGIEKISENQRATSEAVAHPDQALIETMSQKRQVHSDGFGGVSLVNSSLTRETVTELIKSKDTKTLSARLKEGIKDYLKSDTFKNYLTALAKFHHYSSRNVSLLLVQKPDVSLVASFNAWKNKFERTVKKGEKALYVLAPIALKEKDEKGQPKLDEKGQEIVKQVFKYVPVFDVAQTEGKEIPKQLYDLTENFEDKTRYQNLYEALKRTSPVPVKFEELPGETKGYFDLNAQEIVLKRGMAESMTIKTLIHERTHAELHTNSQAVFGDATYSRQEFEAESVAFIVATHLRIDASSYSFGYLASWTNGGEKLEAFEQSLTTIQQEASQLIDKIDTTLSQVMTKGLPENKFEADLKRLTPTQTIHPAEAKEASEDTKKSMPSL